MVSFQSCLVGFLRVVITTENINDFLPCVCARVKGLSNWFCPFVSLSVCQSGENLTLNIDRVK